MNNGLKKMLKHPSLCILHFTFSICLSGCFDEPRPAYETVPAETQVYLKAKGLEVLTPEAVLKDGLIYIDGFAGESADRRAELSASGTGSSDDPRGGYTNLSARVTTFNPASLNYLNLDYNALTNVDALSAFTGLKWLRLNDNRLATLPDLASLTQLKRIYLRNNAFVEVPDVFRPDRLSALDAIDLSGNPILAIPDWFAKREGLAHLSLSRTKIRSLPADLSAWRSLKSLQLGGLELESIDEMKRIRAALPNTTIVF